MKISTKVQTLPIWKNLFLCLIFLFQLSFLSTAQQIGIEKQWSQSHNDRFYEIINFNNNILSSGLTFKDSIFNQNLLIYNVQFVSYGVNTNCDLHVFSLLTKKHKKSKQSIFFVIFIALCLNIKS